MSKTSCLILREGEEKRPSKERGKQEETGAVLLSVCFSCVLFLEVDILAFLSFFSCP